jgi:hypothetical protein
VIVLSRRLDHDVMSLLNHMGERAELLGDQSDFSGEWGVAGCKLQQARWCATADGVPECGIKLVHATEST